MTTRVEVHPANHEYKVTIKEGDIVTEINVPANSTTPYVNHIWFGKSILIEEIPTDVEAWIPPHADA